MKSCRIKAFAKINLSIDVQGILDGGYHKVDMIMQQVSLYDEVLVRWMPQKKTVSESATKDKDRYKGVSVELSSNKYYIPSDARNIAYKAALLMAENFTPPGAGTVRIDILKRIPVAAGLAGGSGNGAAVIHALNVIWNLDLPLSELCRIGSELGADVPFCVMGQAKAIGFLPDKVKSDQLACSCARATGTGTKLEPVKPLNSFLVLSKPPISVSTAEVYRGIDGVDIVRRPDNEMLTNLLNKGAGRAVYKYMANVLEEYTLNAYPVVGETKQAMESANSNGITLMSGSGPTVFSLTAGKRRSLELKEKMQAINKETYWCRTII